MFQAVQIAYWLALSTWFGGVLSVAAAAPVIFRTVRESDPSLPGVRGADLDGLHGTLLAGDIVNNLLGLLARVGLVCAAVLGLAIMGQWLLLWGDPAQRAGAGLRTMLYVAAVVLTVYDWRIVRPRTEKARQDYVAHADDDPDRANAARETFDRYHTEGVNVLMMLLAALLGIVLFSGSIRPAEFGYSFE